MTVDELILLRNKNQSPRWICLEIQLTCIMMLFVHLGNHKHRMICSRKAILGYVMLAIDLASWAASSIAVQALQRTVPDFQLSALRYIGCIVVSSIWIFIKKPSAHLQYIEYMYIIAMSIASVLFNVCYFSAVSLLPLTNASAVYVSFRMIFFTLITTIKSQIPFDKILIISIVGCTAGMVFITQPWLEFMDGFTPGFLELVPNNDKVTQFNFSTYYGENSSFSTEFLTMSNEADVYQSLLFGYLLTLFAAAADAVYFLVVSIYLTSVNPAVQCFASACLCFPISILICFYFEQPVILSDVIDILLVSVHVIATGISLITQTFALQLLNPIKVSVIENVDTIMYIVPQYTFMSHYLYGRKNALEVFGCILIAIFAGLSSFSSSSHYHEDV